ncbi:MAG: transporter [Candidatus Kryptoniota bacterium]
MERIIESIIEVFLAIWWCTIPLGALAQTQDPHEAQPERPTVATHAGTVAPGWLEIEAGGELDHYIDHSQGIGLPVTIKIGVTSNTQFSVFASGVQPSSDKDFQTGDLAFGLKWRLADDLPILGRFAVLPIIKLPTGSAAEGAGTGTVDGSMLLISSNEFGPVELDVNFGYTIRSGNGTAAPKSATLWTASFGGPAVGGLGWAAELYGYPGTQGDAGKSPIVAVLIGPTFTAKPWLVFDLGVIEPVAGPQPHAVYCGGVWNIGRIW